MLDIISVIQKTIDSLPRSAAGRLESEMCLIRLCTPVLMYGNDTDLRGRIAALEARINSAAAYPARKAYDSEPSANTETDNSQQDDADKTDTEAADLSDNPAENGIQVSEKPADSPASAEDGSGTQAVVPGELEPERCKLLLSAVKPKLMRSASTYLSLSKLFLAFSAESKTS